MTGLTNAVSKKRQNLKATYALWFAFYESCRVHQTRQMMHAMKAGLTKSVRIIAELLSGALTNDVKKTQLWGMRFFKNSNPCCESPEAASWNSS